ncbi:MAG: hypothetical protein KAW46_11085 [candidate division Zixibacteria bacterium]|nr:hypothetical protein [candidate division Zixibacteria bacterium]
MLNMTVASISSWILQVLFLSLVLLGSTGCSDHDIEGELSELIAANARHGVNNFVLEKLEQHRIVMLADAGHGQRLYLQSVVSFLNYWLDTNMQRADTGRPVCSDLILVLEADSLQVRATENYFTSGDFRDVTELGFIIASQSTSANLEFYHDLGELCRRIGKYNQTRDRDRQIRLSFFGPEKPIDISNWSGAKREHIFLFERDEYSSQRLVDLLEQHPESKALVFYGDAHLDRSLVNKGIGDKRAEGYYLAHYLTETFGGGGGVYVLGQVAGRSGGGRYYGVFARPGKNYALDNTAFDYREDSYNSGVLSRDGWLVLFDNFTPKVPLFQIHSSALVEFIIDNMSDIRDTTNDFYGAYWNTVGPYLELIPTTTPEPMDPKDTDRIMGAINEWQQWCDTADMNFVKSIESLDLWNRVIDRLAKADTSEVSHYLRLLKWSLGRHNALEWGDNMLPPQEIAEHYRSYLWECRQRLVVEQLVHLLWVCSDDEREAAFAVLKKETGQEFETAKEWMVWWSTVGYRSM